MWSNLLSSGLAVGVSEIVTLPICTVKTHYQNNSIITIPEAIKFIFNQHGWRGFYNASLPAVGSQIIATSTKYTMYRSLNDTEFPTNQHLSPHGARMCNGVISGFTSSIITHPLDVTRIYWQMKTPLMGAIQNQGIKILYRGYSKSIGKIFLGSALYFPLYDYFITHQTSNILTASLGSAVVSTLIIHPVDFLKTRQMYGQPLFFGWNPRPYYRGLTLSLTRICPHFMITMSIIEALKG